MIGKIDTQENRDWTIARIIRKNAGLPYPKYWLTPPPDPPKSPVIFLPLEHNGGVRDHQVINSFYKLIGHVFPVLCLRF